MNKEEKTTNKCPICGRPTHKESKYCIFHASAEEKTEKEFNGVLKEYVNMVKEKDGYYEFEEFIFVGDINFIENFKNNKFKCANFMRAIFKGSVNFKGVTFNGNTNFIGAVFEENVSFEDTIFYGFPYFMGTRFEGFTNFDGAIFTAITFKYLSAAFMGTIFKYNASFYSTIFKGNADFANAIFEGTAEFGHANFNQYVNFKEAIFKKSANFDDAIFKDDIDLSYSKLPPGRELHLKVKGKGTISFEFAYLENVYLNMELNEGVLIDFTDALLKNTKIKKGQIENHILHEEKKNYPEAKEIYLLLKNDFHSIGQYEDESWAFKKERDMERISKTFYSFFKEYKKNNLFKKILIKTKGNLLKTFIVKSRIFSKWLFSKKAIEWFNLSVSNFIYQYGENPWRVRFALIIIFLFAIILNFSGIVISDRTNLIIEFIKESKGDEYTLKYLGPILGSFLNCLYFSVVTFTTLGYGDFQPAVGLSRFFVSLESIIGAITMALFVYTFARKTGGR